MLLQDLGGPDVITRVLIRGKQEGLREKRQMHGERLGDVMLWLRSWRMEPGVTECRWHPEASKDKERDSPWEESRRTAALLAHSRTSDLHNCQRI